MSTKSPELQRKLAQGLSKIALAIRHSQQATAGARGLTPTQAQILAICAADGSGGTRLSWIADCLGVTAPTASDAVGTLEQKGMINKQRSTQDGRSLAIDLTAAGRREVERVGLLPQVLLEASESLSPDEQDVLLRLLVKLIRTLQRRGEIPVARMCVSCQHFRPHAHADPDTPHHCAFVDAAFGDSSQMIDCPDHAALSEAEQDIIWRRYAGEEQVRIPSSENRRTI